MTSGCFEISTMANDSLLTIAGGILGGAAKANQVLEANPGRTSDIAGMSGNSWFRLSLQTAKILTLPAFMYIKTELHSTNMISTLPDKSSIIAGALPLKGTCAALTPAAVLKYSAVRCDVLPAP